MKYFLRSIAIAALVLFSINANALDRCYSGSWSDSQREGEGINIEMNDGVIVAYFYTFDVEGRQVWFTMLGESVLTMMTTVLLDDVDFITKTVDTGVAFIEPITANAIRFRYQHIIEWLPVEQEMVICKGDHCKADRLYKRITQPIACGSQP